MKAVILALAVVGVASTAPLNAQIVGTRHPVGTTTRTTRDCQLASANGTVGDIIFGRGGVATNCRTDRRAADGVWRQVGRGRNNNSIYQRRTLDANGNVVIQRARRNPDGTFTILSTRTARGNNGVRNRDRDDDEDRGFDRRHNDDDNDDRFDRRRDNNDDNRFSRSERNGHGRGRGHRGRD